MTPFFDAAFILNSCMLGAGLAMDAFSVSMANGLNEPDMPAGRSALIAGTFSFFQFLMPMVGWICVHTILEMFLGFGKLIPWIALILLGYIGGKMLIEGIRSNSSLPEESSAVTLGGLMLQGIATSIDALSVGFTIADYGLSAAFAASLIIAAVTFVLCAVGIRIGRVFGMKLAGKASILGGVILIVIGLEIFFRGIL